jgi:hypothetical protein
MGLCGTTIGTKYDSFKCKNHFMKKCNTKSSIKYCITKLMI